MALEDNLNRWIKEINDVLVENIDVKDEDWWKCINTSMLLLNKSLKHLENKTWK